MTAPTSDELATRLKGILDYVRDCATRVHRGEIMDLQGLDKNVIEICDAIAELPPEEARALEDKMSVLIEELERLARSMKDQQDKIGAGGAA
jgi:hypothetical protein